MFEVKIDVLYFLKMAEWIKDIVEEVHLDFSKKGMAVQSMDPSKIAFVSLFIEAGGFDVYKWPKPIRAGVNLNNFQCILKLCKSPLDKLTLRIEDFIERQTTQSAGDQTQAGPQSMVIFLEDENGKRSTEFNMKLVSFSEDKFSNPKLRAESMICLRSSDFASICRDFAHIDSLIGITVIDKGIKLSVVNAEIAQGSIKIQNNDVMQQEENKETSEEKVMQDIEQGAMNVAKLISEMSIEESEELKFPLKYLNAFNKGETFCPVVKIHLSGYVDKGSRDPMLIEFKIGEIGVLKYYLAPKLE